MPLANNIDHDESSLVQDAWDRDEEDGGDLENEGIASVICLSARLPF